MICACRGRGERKDDAWVCSKKANQESRGKWSAGNKKWIFGSRHIIFHFLRRGGGNFALISPARAPHTERVCCASAAACTKSDPERVVISLDLITRAPAGRNYRRAAGRFDFRLCHSAVADSFLCGAQRAASYRDSLSRARKRGSYIYAHLFHSSARGRWESARQNPFSTRNTIGIKRRRGPWAFCAFVCRLIATQRRSRKTNQSVSKSVSPHRVTDGNPKNQSCMISLSAPSDSLHHYSPACRTPAGRSPSSSTLCANETARSCWKVVLLASESQ